MSKDWTKAEIAEASAQMEKEGFLGFDDFNAQLLIQTFKIYQGQGHYPCPRCGKKRMSNDTIRNALSRHADIYVCDICGTDEAIKDFIGDILPLKEWAIAKEPGSYIPGY